MGHIRTSVGREEVELEEEELPVVEMVNRIRAISADPIRAGFNQFNTLVMIEEREAFVPATKERIIRSGQRVFLIPISHGG